MWVYLEGWFHVRSGSVTQLHSAVAIYLSGIKKCSNFISLLKTPFPLTQFIGVDLFLAFSCYYFLLSDTDNEALADVEEFLLFTLL